MKELIKIKEEKGKKAVSARELYEFLGYNKSAWKRWYTKNIINNPYAENKVDWVGFNLVLNGNETQDFALSIKFAKKLSMMAKTKKGEEARDYFIECERLSESSQPPQLSNAEILLQIAQTAVEQEREIKFLAQKQNELEEKVNDIAQRTKTDLQYTAVVGFANRIGLRISRTDASKIGKSASCMCTKRGFSMGKINDPRFGYVKTYPDEILKEAFKVYYPNLNID